MLRLNHYFLGMDVGGTNTRALIADSLGNVVGYGQAGPGNHEQVGFDGLADALETAFCQAIASAGIARVQIEGAGFGMAGFDWPSQEAPIRRSIGALGLDAPIGVVNDAIPGLLAGSADGWGVSVVSGTGCNCWGWDITRQKIAQATGAGLRMGEGAGASELMWKAVAAAAMEWTMRGPKTSLSAALVRYAGARDLPDLLEGLTTGRYEVEAPAAPLVFQAAAQGDAVAISLVEWAGTELGELANAIIRQLGFETLAFDVVQIGSMYDGSPRLGQAMGRAIHAFAPRARLVRLNAPPVIGAVLLGMEQAGCPGGELVRQNLIRSTQLLAQEMK